MIDKTAWPAPGSIACAQGQALQRVTSTLTLRVLVRKSSLVLVSLVLGNMQRGCSRITEDVGILNLVPPKICNSFPCKRAFLHLQSSSSAQAGACHRIPQDIHCARPTGTSGPKDVRHSWPIIEDVFTSTAVQSLSAEILEAFCASNEFGVVTLDAPIKCCMGIMGQESYRAPKKEKGMQLPSMTALPCDGG